ncbi:MAG TPA: AraC family transcriptional regulator, partial [Pseudomonas sp.]|nr:AraC family transcriptional regulator [Pseudomonas sp.]HBZ94902.1 AraC family transcriptional regulator [Pseudomonas sp.]
KLCTSNQGPIDEQGFARAKALINEEQVPVYRIAEALGFSETASYRHGFQRWSGVAPSRFRE